MEWFTSPPPPSACHVPFLVLGTRRLEARICARSMMVPFKYRTDRPHAFTLPAARSRTRKSS
eukprot:scaffold219396_cov37-Tisochrysis_lutea.AAC.1